MSAASQAIYTKVRKNLLARKTPISFDANGTPDCVDIPKYADSYYHPNKGEQATGIRGNGKDIFKNANPKFYQKIKNDVNDPNQLPQRGDTMCFDATPKAGYTNKYKNIYGHTGMCDGTRSGGYVLLEQATGSKLPPRVKYYPWKFRPCIGWLRPILASKPKLVTTAVVRSGTWNVRTAPNGRRTGKYVRGGQRFDNVTIVSGWAKIPQGYIGPATFTKVVTKR